MKRLLGLLLVLPLLLAACDRGSVDVERGANGGLDVTVSMTESEVNAALSDALERAVEQGRADRVENLSINLQAGALVINGDFAGDNGASVSGSITVAVSVGADSVDVEITAANVEGWAADDERLQTITQRIEDALNNRAFRDNARGSARLTAITITDDALTFTINVQRNNP